MKVSNLLAASALTALAVAASGQAQPPISSDLMRNSAGAAPEFTHTRDAAPPAPRGDLRGDIASNARTRPDNEREERPRHH